MSSIPTQANTKAKIDGYSKDVPWYHYEIGDFNPDARELLEKYSHIPPDEVVSHVLHIRDRAWAIQPYPCIGQFNFLSLSICLQPCYPRVLSFLKEPGSQHTLLDLGCCFAQDVRKLVHDGVPSENLYACDLEPRFLDLSFDLFRDRDTMKGHFFSANALDVHGPLDDLKGKMDVVYIGSFLHVFSWDDQVKVCKRIIRTLKPRKGSLVFGRQTGNVKGGEVQMKMVFEKSQSPVWRHDVESFTKLWDVAGLETGTRWKTWGMLDESEGIGPAHWAGEGLRRFKFEVERVE